MIRVIVLGSGAAIPTKSRNCASVAIQYDGEILLFDCGEGTQRQLIKAGKSIMKITKIFITHLHGDHIFGIPGLFHSMSLMHREKPIDVYGPKGIQKFIDFITSEENFFHKTFDINVHEIEGEKAIVCETDMYRVEALKVDHSVPTYAYAFIERDRPGKFLVSKAIALGIPRGRLWGKLQRGKIVKLPDGRVITPDMVLGPPRKGKKVVYTGDTRFTESLIDFAKEADLLIHDSTFDESLSEKAREYFHSTCTEAAEIAKRANVKKLMLIHVSNRYEKNPELLVDQARKIFENTILAKDLMVIELK